jgi:nucleoside-diphosphate-sugar epimerase
MNLLVIGGTGFISGALVGRLLEGQHDVTILTRGHTPASFGTSARLSMVRGDRRDESVLREIAQRRVFDVVYDLVAYEPDESAAAARVFGGKVGRFVHCSTISVYMVSRRVQCPITEDQDKRPLMEYWPRNPFGMDYGIKKRQCEDMLWQAHDEKRFPVTMLRPTFVCGPNDPARRDWFWIERILDGKPLLIPGSGDFSFQNVFIDDVADAFVRVLERPTSIGQAYNVASEELYSLNEYLALIGELLGREPALVHIGQERFQQLPFSSHPRGDVFPFNVQRTAVFSIEKAKRELGFRSTPLRQWLRTMIDWYVENANEHSLGYDRRHEELEVIEQELTAHARGRVTD